MVGTEGFINSGVQFWSVRLRQPANEMCGFQADIGAGHSGCLYRRIPPEQIPGPRRRRGDQTAKKPGEWNYYEVRCEGPRIRIRLNGEQTVDYSEPDTSLPREGLIGLQMHGGCKAGCLFATSRLRLCPEVG